VRRSANDKRFISDISLGFPEGLSGPEMMDKFRAQRFVHSDRSGWRISERFGTNIITETVARVDFSQRPFKYWREGEEEEADFETADTYVF
jgi:thioredoxin reductase (NADPH)